MINHKNTLIKFDNGLTLVFQKTPNFYTAEVCVLFKVGSENELREFGISHLLEHSHFKGTTKYNQEQISEEFNKICAEPDASTSSEITKYKLTFPKPNLQKATELLSHILFDSVFDEKQIENEKKVIIEEIKMYNDRPSSCAFENLMGSMFKDSGLGNKIAGDIKLLKKIKPADLFEYKEKYYNADNCLIAVLGDFEEKEVRDLISKHFESRFNKTKSKNNICKNWTEKMYRKSESVFEAKDTEQANVFLGFYAPPATEKELIKLELINFILGGPMSSRLFVKVRNKLSLCYSIYSQQYSFKNNGMLIIAFSTTESKVKKAIDAVKSEIDKIRKSGVKDSEFNDAKENLLNMLLMENDLPRISLTYLARNGQLFNLEEHINFIKNLTKSIDNKN